MANINKVKIGTTDPDAIMFDKYYQNLIGDTIFTNKVLYSSDGGGYYVKGLSIMPGQGEWNIYWWPWNLGISNGALKDVNDGAHEWGYVQDGTNKNVTSGINTNFPTNGWSETDWNVSICIFASEEASNYTDEEGNKYIDFGDIPIVIKFNSEFLSGATITLNASHTASLSEDGATITVNRMLLNDSYRVAYIKWSDTSVEFIRSKMTDIIVDVTGLSRHYSVMNRSDASTVECWDAYCEDAQVWHKDKTVENCWKKYGMITDTWKDNEDDEEPTVHNTYIMNMSGIPSEISDPILPIVTDYEEHILPKNNSGIKPIQWNHKIANPEFWNNIKNYLLTHPVVIVEGSYVTEGNPNYSDYTEADNNNNVIDGWFNGANMTGDLTVKFDGYFRNRTLLNWINGNVLDTLTIQLLQDNLKFSVTQFMFRACTINTIRVIDKEGNPKNDGLKAIDCSGMCEYSSIPYFPDIIEWSDCFDSKGKRYVPVQFMFSYTTSLTEVAQHGNERDSLANTIIMGPYSPQVFQQCHSLTKIGPILDMSSINLTEEAYGYANDAYQMFSGCVKLSDVRLKNLNGNYVRFDGDAYLGNLPSLDTASVEYLFSNLMDLTSYDAAVVTQNVNNSWYGNGANTNSGWNYTASIWMVENEDGTHVQSRGNSTVNNAVRVAESSTSMFYYTTKAIDTNVTVTGLQESDQLVWRTGTSDMVLSNDTSAHLTNSEGTTAGFILRRLGSQSQVNDWEHPVSITYDKVFDQYAPKAASAKLYCPEEWTDKVTSEMITAANAKGWTIYIGGVEVQPN